MYNKNASNKLSATVYHIFVFLTVKDNDPVITVLPDRMRKYRSKANQVKYNLQFLT